MTVTCIASPGKDDSRATARWLTVGKKYLVLEVIFDVKQGQLKYRVMSDDKFTPALFPSNLFQLCDGSLSPTWVAEWKKSDFYLRPISWSVENFWMAYFDGEEHARDTFEREYRIMRELHGVS